MLEMHGWISVALSTDGEGEDGLIDAVRPLIDRVATIRSEQNLISIRPLNGRYFIDILSNSNHLGIEFDNVMSLIAYVAINYVGSYGLIYVRNDEDVMGNENDFVVYKLVRGALLISEDYYLSPCNPVIED